jgi:rSAM/selenodomain-associated transferase 1
MKTIAVAIFCKTPLPGQSKTRLSPPLRSDECADLSACFIRDLTATIHAVARTGDVTGYAVYTPIGTETALRTLLPSGFRLLPQCEGGFGTRLETATRALLDAHAGAILVNSDSPTLPASILRQAVDATRRGGAVVLSPAYDGGYTLIGVSKLHDRLYVDIPWSTAQVYGKTIERAGEIGLPVVNVPGWYDVDDGASLALLEAELAGERSQFADGAEAPATRAYLSARNAPLRAESAPLRAESAPSRAESASLRAGLSP